jgi:nucleotide-binding universal stress UspA family protein
VWSCIVVGTDGSVTAQEAVRQAAGLAAQSGARLVVCHAYSALSTSAALAMSGAGVGVGLAVDAEADLEQQRTAAEALLTEAVHLAGADPGTTRTVAMAGGPADVLLRVAEQLQADLVVVGNRGMHGARRLLLSSVPNRVAHAASCSVLVVRTC